MGPEQEESPPNPINKERSQVPSAGNKIIEIDSPKIWNSRYIVIQLGEGLLKIQAGL